jgi:hypothetical protein
VIDDLGGKPRSPAVTTHSGRRRGRWRCVVQ